MLLANTEPISWGGARDYSWFGFAFALARSIFSPNVTVQCYEHPNGDIGDIRASMFRIPNTKAESKHPKEAQGICWIAFLRWTISYGCMLDSGPYMFDVMPT